MGIPDPILYIPFLMNEDDLLWQRTLLQTLHGNGYLVTANYHRHIWAAWASAVLTHIGIAYA